MGQLDARPTCHILTNSDAFCASWLQCAPFVFTFTISMDFLGRSKRSGTTLGSDLQSSGMVVRNRERQVVPIAAAVPSRPRSSRSVTIILVISSMFRHFCAVEMLGERFRSLIVVTEETLVWLCRRTRERRDTYTSLPYLV